VTVPVGDPPVELPVTVAVSLFESLRAMLGLVGLVAVEEDASLTLKHSVEVLSVLVE
jgi:hypothetical protein